MRELGLMAVHAEALELQLLASGSDASRRRFQHLRRLLFVADAITGVVSGALVGAVAHATPSRRSCSSPCSRSRGRSPPSSAASTPARICALGERRQRGAASSCSPAWRCRGRCSACSSLPVAPHPRPARSSARSRCAAVAGFTRAGARIVVHRAPELRQRTLIVGSGDRRRAGSPSASATTPSSASRSIGYIDDHRRPVPGTAICPTSAASPRCSDLVALDRVDRVMIAFSRAHHEELLDALRVCRDAGVAVDVVPRLFEFLDGRPHGRPDRRHAAALDRRADASPAPRASASATLDVIGAGAAAARARAAAGR